MSHPITGMPHAWSKVARDYRQHVAPDFVPAAGVLCRAVGVNTSDRVVDVACGPGTAAFAARELGAALVVGVDYAKGMCVAAREDPRCVPPVYCVAGDAVALPLRSSAFDVVISSFGLVFAADPVAAAAEAGRVLRSGGRLGLLAWPPGGSIGAYQEAAFRYLSVPPSTHDPFQWGVPQQARAWLGTTFRQVEFQPIEVPFEAASPAAAWGVLRTATGRVAAAYAELASDLRARQDEEMERFFSCFRRADGRVYWPREAFVIRAVHT